MKFAEKLKTIRKQTGLSQEQLAEKIGVSRQAVTKGIGTSISYEKDGKKTERFDMQDSDNIIELNGIKSELVINKYSKVEN